MKAGEEQSVFPQRLVETYTMKITSRCSPDPQVKVGDFEDQTLLFAQPFELPKVNAASPGEKLFTFVLKPPLESHANAIAMRTPVRRGAPEPTQYP
ncbi:MAG TPA: hypothetical protein VKS22_03470 [Candidatus Binataceae bacterium]|nr:hypothetical protein [Candidatus Binataceae bacterium]